MALRANARCSDLRLHVAQHEIRQPDIGAKHMPDLLVAPPFLIDLNRLEPQPLRVAVDRIDNAATAWRVCPDVEMVRRRHRVAGERAIVEDRHDERHVRPMRCASIGIVVHDDIARLDRLAALLEHLEHATDIAGDGSRLKWRALLGLGQLSAIRVNQCSAEILGFADDRGVAHAHELVAHLDGDVFEGALDDLCGDRVNAALRRVFAHDTAPAVRIRLPWGSAVNDQFGGTTVVVSSCRMIAGPAIEDPTGRSARR